MTKTVEIWTDGFCWPNPGGAMGFAANIVDGGSTVTACDARPPCPENTNNVAELLAICLGLKFLEKPHRVVCCTDSKYVADGFASLIKHERPDRHNAVHFAEIAQLSQGHDFSIEWVRGGSEFNREADKAAIEAAMSFMAKRDVEIVRRWQESGSTEPLYKWLLGHAGMSILSTALNLGLPVFFCKTK
jgi:ribonuclease HI